MHLKWDKGFTLVEILASIVILTIVLTVFMKFFALAAMFANENEKMLTASNDAREVLSLIQENQHIADYLAHYQIIQINNDTKDITNIDENPITSSTNHITVNSSTVTGNEVLNGILYENPSSSVDLKNLSLSFSQADSNFLQVDVSIINPENNNILSETYGYIPKKARGENVVFNLKDLPSANDSENLYIGTSNSPDHIFQPVTEHNVAYHMKNSIDIAVDSDFTFMQLKKEIDEFTIKGIVEFIQSDPSNGGGYGIFIDGTVEKSLEGSNLEVKNYVGNMLLFEPLFNTISLGLCKLNTDNLKTECTTIQSEELTSVNENIILKDPLTTINNWNWDDITEINVLAKNDYIMGQDISPLSTSREYRVTILQNGLEFTINFKGELPTTFDNYSKYIGLRLWSDPSKEAVVRNEIKVYHSFGAFN